MGTYWLVDGNVCDVRRNARCDDEVAGSLALKHGSSVFRTEDRPIHYKMSVIEFTSLCSKITHHSQLSAFCTPQWSAR